MKFRSVLITGGAGFIGSNYVRYALHHHPEWRVVVLDKLTYAGNLENLADVLHRIEFHHGDIADPKAVRRAMAGVEAVLNFAAESHVDRSLLDPRPFVRTNVEGTLVLLEEARRAGVCRFLQVSTDEVYGDLSPTDRWAKEEDPLRPRSPYAASKAAAEHFVLAYGESHGLEAVITRGSNTYGPYQYPEKIIPLFVTNALENKPLPVYGNGSAVRDYLHVEDHCAGIDLILHQGKAGRAYNLGARLQVSGLEVAQRILEILGKPESLIRFVPDRPGHDYRYAIDPSEAEALGWQRRWSFEDGLRQTVAWYANNQGWWRRLKETPQFWALERQVYSQGWRREP
ncbi:MAG: dTDP-glucose 4,6-dehydratase [Thermus sp.]|uniref:dTDP-glucose 4,6-dehydratase n=1 Tax=Thermus TaxID=270 RepID=UPI001FA9B339|nr:dTDP-glucose 4,6-dehydratase [Thermus thalpophilus]